MNTSSPTSPAQLQPPRWSSGGKKHIFFGNICPQWGSRSLWLSPAFQIGLSPACPWMAISAAPPHSKASDGRTRLPDVATLGRTSVSRRWGYSSAVRPPDGQGDESEQESDSRRQTPCSPSRRPATPSSVPSRPPSLAAEISFPPTPGSGVRWSGRLGWCLLTELWSCRGRIGLCGE